MQILKDESEITFRMPREIGKVPSEIIMKAGKTFPRAVYGIVLPYLKCLCDSVRAFRALLRRQQSVGFRVPNLDFGRCARKSCQFEAEEKLTRCSVGLNGGDSQNENRKIIGNLLQRLSSRARLDPRSEITLTIGRKKRSGQRTTSGRLTVKAHLESNHGHSSVG
jgi:hypothetical protein